MHKEKLIHKLVLIKTSSVSLKVSLCAHQLTQKFFLLRKRETLDILGQLNAMYLTCSFHMASRSSSHLLMFLQSLNQSFRDSEPSPLETARKKQVSISILYFVCSQTCKNWPSIKTCCFHHLEFVLVFKNSPSPLA